MKPTKECIEWFDKQGYKLQFARNQDGTTVQPWNFLKKQDDGFGGFIIKELGIEQAQEIYDLVQKEKKEIKPKEPTTIDDVHMRMYIEGHIIATDIFMMQIDDYYTVKNIQTPKHIQDIFAKLLDTYYKRLEYIKR